MKKNKGISNITDDNLTAYINLSAGAKLDWLEEAFNFIKKFSNKEKFDNWLKIKRSFFEKDV
jgi:hypothetical protein